MTVIVCSIRDYKMCLPNTYIMYEQTANTAFNAHTRMLRIEQFQFECGTLFKFTAINHGTDGFFFSCVFLCVYAWNVCSFGMLEPFVPSHFVECLCLFWCTMLHFHQILWQMKQQKKLYAITWNLNECRCAISITIATFGDHFNVLTQWKHALSALY